VEEVSALAAGRICRGEQRRACQSENGAFAEWACQNCLEYRRPETISPWTWHLVFLYRLKRAGFPFQADDLSLETWMLLGLIQRVFEAAENTMMVRKTHPLFS
jgi:hypothetical protein